MSIPIPTQVLVSGRGEGEMLRFTRPISFWGGIDPRTGRVTDPRHPQHDLCIAGRVMVMERLVGSSSGSSIVLELASAGLAPAGLILGATDAIATLGAVVAREMGLRSFPVLLIDPSHFKDLPTWIRMTEEGRVIDAQKAPA